MKNVFAVWVGSLGVVARSYRIVVVLAALTALWVLAAYEWLGLPESSTLLLILALVWAIVQLFATVGIVAGAVSGAVEAAATGARRLPLGVLWTVNWKKLLNTLLLCIPAAVVVWLCGLIFHWINARSVEFASFLTFHFQKPLSYVRIEEIYRVIEGLLWIVLNGFLLSFFVALFRGGWREAGRQRWKLLAGCAFQTPFLTSLLSVAVFGGIADDLVNCHPLAPAGFWDYTDDRAVCSGSDSHFRRSAVLVAFPGATSGSQARLSARLISAGGPHRADSSLRQNASGPKTHQDTFRTPSAVAVIGQSC